MTVFLDDLSDYVLSLRLKDRPPFAAPFQWVILSNGLAEHDDRVILFGFENNLSNPTLVVKVPRLPGNAWSLQIEYDRLMEVWSLLGDEAAFRLSQPVAMVEIGGQPALITTYLRGESFLRVTDDVLWNDPDRVLAFAIDAAKSLRDVMERTAVALLENEQITSDFRKKIEKFQEMYPLSVYEAQVVTKLLTDVETAVTRGRRKILLQGDFWHGNIIRNEEHGKLMLIDWQYSRWSTDAALDVYLFLLAGALWSVSSEKTPKEKAQIAAKILLKWNEQIIPAYLAAFGEPEGYTLLPLRSGMLMCCVEKAVCASMELGFDHAEDVVWYYLLGELANWKDDSD